MEINSTVYIEIDDFKNNYEIITTEKINQINEEFDEIFNNIPLVSPPESLIFNLIKKIQTLSEINY